MFYDYVRALSWSAPVDEPPVCIKAGCGHYFYVHREGTCTCGCYRGDAKNFDGYAPN